MHAEYNLGQEPTTLFQIWIRPNQTGVAPRWEQREFPKDHSADRLVPLASGQDDALRDGALFIHQDATLYGATLGAGSRVAHDLGADRLGYLVTARGRVRLNGETEIGPRDGAVIRQADTLSIEALEDAEIVLADLPLAA
jgi:hypothetical protein